MAKAEKEAAAGKAERDAVEKAENSSAGKEAADTAKSVDTAKRRRKRVGKGGKGAEAEMKAEYKK